MSTALHRGLLVFLAATGGIAGFWAYFAPCHWYNNFPGMGLRWLPPFGPFNEHFCKDIGAMYLALTLLSVLTIVHITNTTLRRVTGGAWITFNLLHTAYHVTMLHMFTARDAMLNVVTLAAVLAASFALLIPVPERVQRS
ncbi:MAG: hypothetical protein VX424_03185 [Actinomycetota bacterium]|nr:hypothetical protein [Actinomycetota bacterium]